MRSICLNNGRDDGKSAVCGELKRHGRCETVNHMVAMSFMFCVSYSAGWIARSASDSLAGRISLLKYTQIGICSTSSQGTTSLVSYVLAIRRKSLIDWPLSSLLRRAVGGGRESLRVIRWREGLHQALIVGCGESAFMLRPPLLCGTGKCAHLVGLKSFICQA